MLLYTTVHGCDDFSSFINSLAAQFFAISPFEPWLTPDKVERVRYKTLGLNLGVNLHVIVCFGFYIVSCYVFR